MQFKFNFRNISIIIILTLTLAGIILAYTSGLLVAQASKGFVSDQPTNEYTNLAWFYKPPADGNYTLLGENFKTFIMTKGNESARDQLLSLGGSHPMLEYLRFEAIMDPGSCTVTPWQNNVAYMPGDFCNISANHPDWFLLDGNGNRMSQVTNGITFYLMDPGNPGWRDFFLGRVSQVLSNDPVWDGVFLDNVEVTNEFHIDNNHILANYPDNESFSAAVQGFVQYLHDNYFQPQGKLLYANLVSRTDDTLFTSYMTYLDGAMHEGWSIDDQTRYRDAATWEKHLKLVEQAQVLGKPLILVSHGTQADTELQQFAYASYLLVTDGITSFRYGSSAAYNQAWMYDNYQLPIGVPLGARYQDGSAWKRDFSNGSVSVDPESHAVSITLIVYPSPTATRVPPTATMVPPTATKVPPTATKVPPTATKTRMPATATRTRIPPTATKTRVPATATSTRVPATATRLPATATSTRLPATATRLPATFTPVPPTATSVSPAALPTQSTTYENNNPAFVYSSGWTTVKDRRASSGSYVRSTTLQNTIKLPFTGSSFKIAFLTQSRGGHMQVLVDDVLITTIDQMTSSTYYLQTWRLLEANTLPYGKHTLTLLFEGPSGTTLTMDRVTIY